VAPTARVWSTIPLDLTVAIEKFATACLGGAVLTAAEGFIVGQSLFQWGPLQCLQGLEGVLGALTAGVSASDVDAEGVGL
jgi:hypothetical protein